jgi:Cdc6-like AAA superfamily ATPase
MKNKKRKHPQSSEEVRTRAQKLESLINLSNTIQDSEKRTPLTFDDFLHIASEQPETVFRNIFQLFHDMAHHYVPEGEDEYAPSEHSIGFMKYDVRKLFVENCDDPFFADRLFANRFMNLIKGFKNGIQNNRIYLFEGPPGSGKSTFLNNLLMKFEQYVQSPEGLVFTTHWKLDVEKLSNYMPQINALVDSIEESTNKKITHENENYFEIACPNNCHPILQIPKMFRRQLLDELITNKKVKDKIFYDKEFPAVSVIHYTMF